MLTNKWNNSVLNEFYSHKFDFNNQTKKTYDDWLAAFDIAVKKCSVNGCFMGLSSGYDSGATSYSLYKQNLFFKAYTVLNNENERIIRDRLKYVPEYSILVMTPDLKKRYFSYLMGKVNSGALYDYGGVGVVHIFDTAKKEGHSIYISNQGADEIISDYALSTIYGQSEFHGVFPRKLYEWPNFRGNLNYFHLRQTEEIADVYGIKVRYPYLDIDLVQEFLWLTPELKNKCYKAPLKEYLTLNNVPFEENVKYGFHPL